MRQQIALVTGASRGIGREVARELSREGYAVLLGVRDLRRAPSFPAARALELDVSSAESISRAAEQVGELDVLVNNAGIYQGPHRDKWEVNVRGPLLLTRALAPKLRKGARVVMVSSGLGALQSQSPSLVRRLQDPGLDFEAVLAMCDEAPGGYGATKATLVALARLFAKELRPGGVLVNAVDPGWVRTDMGGSSAPRSVEQGAASVLWACRLAPDGPTGGFFRDGRELPS